MPIRTVTVTSHVSAQGPVVGKLPDGRLVIDTGTRRAIGWPVPETPAPESRAAASGLAGAAVAALGLWAAPSAQARARLLDASNDPTREVQSAFAAWWEAQGNRSAAVEQSQGGSGSQATTAPSPSAGT